MKRKLWIVLLTAVLTVTALAGFAITANATGSALTLDFTEITLNESNHYTYEAINTGVGGSYIWSKNPTTGEYTLSLLGTTFTETLVFPTDGKVTILVSGSCSIGELKFAGENRANVEIKKDPSSAAAVNTLTLGSFSSTWIGDMLTIADDTYVTLNNYLYLGDGSETTLVLGKNASLWVSGGVTAQRNLTMGEGSTLTVDGGPLAFCSTPTISLGANAKISITPAEGSPALRKDGTDATALANLPLPAGDGYSYGAVGDDTYLLYNGQKVTGTVTLTQTHTHDWSYFGVDNVLRASCSCGALQTLTLTMPSEIDEVDVTSATKATITLDTADGRFGEYSRSALENIIRYFARGGAAGDAAPSAAPGNYTVKLKLDELKGGATAYVDYTVTEHTHSWTYSVLPQNIAIGFEASCSNENCEKYDSTRVELTFPSEVADNELSTVTSTWEIDGDSATAAHWTALGYSGTPTLEYCPYVTGLYEHDRGLANSTSTLPTTAGKYWVMFETPDERFCYGAFTITEHTHTWTYAWKNDGSYAVVTATCGAMENCYKNAELQMIAPACTEEYGDGDMRARIQVTPALTTFGGYTVASLEEAICYETNYGGDLGGDEPTAAGTYKAYATVWVGTTGYMPGVTYTITPHTCTWTYREDGDNCLRAECTRKAKGCSKNAKVVLEAPELTCEGETGKSADVKITITGSGNSGNNGKFGDYTEAQLRGMVTYYKYYIASWGSETNAWIKSAPTTAGKYLAQLVLLDDLYMDLNYTIAAHTHDWVYSFPTGGNGSVATATCSYESCSYHTNPATLTLTAPAHKMVYDGLRTEPDLIDSEDAFPVGSYLLTYYSASNLTTPLTSAPHNTAGSYVVVATNQTDTSISLRLTYTIAEHVHDWEYTLLLDGDRLRAACQYAECPGAADELQLVSPTLTKEYGTGSAEATVDIVANQIPGMFCAAYSKTQLQGMIEYYKYDANAYFYLGYDAPTTAGNYRAQLQVGNRVVYTDYTIDEHTHSWSYTPVSNMGSLERTENMLYATCTSDHCEYGTNGTPIVLTLNEPTKKYTCGDGSYEATVTWNQTGDVDYSFIGFTQSKLEYAGYSTGWYDVAYEGGGPSNARLTLTYKNGSIELAIKYDVHPHYTEWTDYRGTTSSNTAECGDATCEYLPITVTVVAPAHTVEYDGNSANATYTVTKNGVTLTDATAIQNALRAADLVPDLMEIKYVDGSDSPLAQVPTAAGSYKAVLYYEYTQIAQISYTIAEHEHEYTIIGATQNVAPIYCAKTSCSNSYDAGTPILTVTLNAPEHKEVYDGKSPAATWSGFPAGKSWSDYGFSEPTVNYDNMTTYTGYADPQDTKDVVGEYVIWAQIDRGGTLTVTNTISAHQHTWSYTPVSSSAGLNQLYATCTSDHCEYGTNGTPVVLTLNAPTKTYVCTEGSNAAAVTWNQTGDVDYSFIGFTQTTLEYSTDQTTWSSVVPNAAGTKYVRLSLPYAAGPIQLTTSYTLSAHSAHWESNGEAPSNRLICDNPNCQYLPLTITLNAPARTVEYDGNSANATYSVIKNNVTLTDAAEIASALNDAGVNPEHLYILYVEPISGIPTTTAPTTAGNYWAVLCYETPEKRIATVYYTIAEHEHTWGYAQWLNDATHKYDLAATCNKTAEGCTARQLLSMSAPALTAQWGTEDANVTLTVTGSSDGTFGGYTIAQLRSFIVYSVWDSAENVWSYYGTVPPTEPGKYEANLTLDGSQLSCEYEITAHQHSWSYSYGGGATATATCQNTQCGKTITLTLYKPYIAMEYDGAPTHALLGTDSEDGKFGALNPHFVFTIRYYNAADTAFENPLSAAPSVAGSYVARATLDSDTSKYLTVSYSITPHVHNLVQKHVNQNTVNIGCTYDACPNDSDNDDPILTLTMNAPEHKEVYDGKSPAVTWTGFPEGKSWSDYGITEPIVKYLHTTLNTFTYNAQDTKDVVGSYEISTNLNMPSVAQGSITVTNTIAEHQHDWSYSYSGGATATATCQNTQCGKTITLTLYKPFFATEYDGVPNFAYLDTDSDNGKFGALIPDVEFTIRYYNAADTAFENPLSGAPSVAGSYVARATWIGDTTKYLTVSYTIAAHQHEYAIIGATQNVAPIYCNNRSCSNNFTTGNPILTLTLNAPEHKEVHDGKSPAVTWSGFPEGKSWSDYGFSEPTVNYYNLTTNTGTTNPQDTKDVVGEYKITAQIGGMGSIYVTNTITAHRHTWSYSYSGGNNESSVTITAMCTNASCAYHTDTVTVTVSVPAKEYACDTKSAEYTVTWNKQNMTFADIGVTCSIQYCEGHRNAEGDYVILSSAPTTPDSYLIAVETTNVGSFFLPYELKDHELNFFRDDNEFTASCVCGTCTTYPVTVKLTAPTLTTEFSTGNANATYTVTDKNGNTFDPSAWGWTDVILYYTGTGDTVYARSTTPPTTAGTYKVELEANNVRDGSQLVYCTVNYTIAAHTHSWQYSGSSTEDSLTASCTVAGCSERDTIWLESTSYVELDGRAHVTSVQSDTIDNPNKKLGAYTETQLNSMIQYYSVEGDTETLLSGGIPDEAGTYKAKLTVDGKTVLAYVVVVMHSHDWDYSFPGGNTATATCKNTLCDKHTHAETLTLHTPDYTELTPNENTARLTSDSESGRFGTYHPSSDFTFTYYAAADTTLANPLIGAPATAGSYIVVAVAEDNASRTLKATYTVAAHEHEWDYAGTNATLVADCMNSLCYEVESITLAAPTSPMQWDGGSHKATIQLEGGAATFGAYTAQQLNAMIQYTNSSDPTAAVDLDVPGTYTAALTVGTGVHAATATVTFTVVPHAHAWSYSFPGGNTAAAWCTNTHCQKVHTLTLHTPNYTVEWEDATHNYATLTCTGSDNGTFGDLNLTSAFTFTYYAADDTARENPMTAAPERAGTYLVVAACTVNSAAKELTATYTVAAHTHDWEYSELSNNLIAHCKKEDKCYALAHSLYFDEFGTIEQWDGSDRTVTLNFSNSNSADTFGTYTKTQLLGMLQYYRRNDDNTWTPIDSIPDEAGLYKAELTVDGNTIFIGVTINPHRCRWDYSFPGGETATAWCTNTNCPHNTSRDTLTLTMHTPSMEHGTGDNYAAISSTGENGYFGGYSLSDFTIRYYAESDTARANPMTTAPTKAGTYVVVAAANDNAARTLSKTYTIAPHTHSWIYEAQDNTITAKCHYHDISTCPQEPITMTLIAPAHVKEGDNLAPEVKWTVSNGTEKLGSVNVSNGVIKYYSVVDDVATELTAAPTKAGTYFATYTVSSEQGDLSATVVYTVNNRFSQEEIVWIIAWLNSRRFNVTASAGEGGTITSTGTTDVKFGTSKTYTITPDEGYEIVSVVVDGKPVGKQSSYTFQNVSADHTITVTFAKKTWTNPFTDVASTDPYYESIRYVVEKGLMNGVSDTEFDPAGKLTRAQIVTMLWRMAGQPKAENANFTDVADGMWYTEAINWAAEQGIVLGFGDGTFQPDETLTNAQLAVIMYRYAQKLGEGFTGAWAYRMDYADLEDVPDWAFEAISWLTMKNIYTADSDGNLNATGDVNRANAADFLYNFGLFLETKK